MPSCNKSLYLLPSGRKLINNSNKGILNTSKNKIHEVKSIKIVFLENLKHKIQSVAKNIGRIEIEWKEKDNTAKTIAKMYFLFSKNTRNILNNPIDIPCLTKKYPYGNIKIEKIKFAKPIEFKFLYKNNSIPKTNIKALTNRKKRNPPILEQNKLYK